MLLAHVVIVVLSGTLIASTLLSALRTFVAPRAIPIG